MSYISRNEISLSDSPICTGTCVPVEERIDATRIESC
jgi:hypothetical protein